MLTGGFLTAHVGVAHGQMGPAGAAGLETGNWCCLQVCPDVGELLTGILCLMAAGPAESGKKVGATGRHQVQGVLAPLGCSPVPGAGDIGEGQKQHPNAGGPALTLLLGVTMAKWLQCLPAPRAGFVLQQGVLS